MKKAIVTGGAGFIGSHMSRKLVSKGYYVYVIDNLFRGTLENIKDLISTNSIQFINENLADIKCKKVLSKLLNNENEIDLIIHYAAINGTQFFYDRPQEVAMVNSISTFYLMETLEECKNSLNKKLKVIFSSTSETYGEPLNLPTNENDLTYFRIDQDRDSYAIAKMMSEFYVRLYSINLNISYVILRIFNVYGPNMVGSKYGQVVPEFINRLKNGEHPLKLIGSGDQKRSFIYIDDHIEITWKVIESGVKNEVINLGNDNEISIKQLAIAVMNTMGIDPKFTTSEERKGDHMRRKPDISKLIRIIGKYDFIDLESGLKKCI